MKRLLGAFAAAAMCSALMVAPALADPLTPAEAAADGLPATAATAVADPVTQDSWDRLLMNTRTEYVGNFWTDKSVTTDATTVLSGGNAQDITVNRTEGATFLTDLSALSSSLYTKITSDTPQDIVLVVDVSSSMADTWPGQDAGGESKLSLATAALKDFMAAVITENDRYAALSGEDGLHRVAVVKYAGDVEPAIGNDFSGVGLNYTQVVSGFTYYTTGGAAPEGAQSSAYAGADDFASAVDALQAGGRSRADLGIQLAAQLFEGSVVYGDGARDGAERIVVFLTDGEPTNASSGFDAQVANGAIRAAHELKLGTRVADKATIYSLGFYEGASADGSSVNSSTEAGRLNGYLAGVSSAYPDATSYTTAALGQRATAGDYLYAPATAAELSTDLTAIVSAIATADEGLPVSSATTDDAVTFTDYLGDFMEVKDVNGIVYGDTLESSQLYTTRTVSEPDADGVVAYTYVDDVTPVVTKGNPDREAILAAGANLNQISIRVLKSDDPSVGDTLEVSIPARLVPLVEYEVATGELTSSGRAYSMTRSDARPIHVFYSSGLKAEALEALAPEALAKQQLLAASARSALYGQLVQQAREHNDGQNALLYGSDYLELAASDDDERTIGTAMARLTVSSKNSYYFFTEDTPLYVQVQHDDLTTSWEVASTTTTGLSAVSDELLENCAYVDEYFGTVDGVVQPVREYVRLNAYGPYASAPAVESADSLVLGDDGVFYIKAGTVENYHRGHLDALKDANATSTADYTLKGRVTGGSVEEYLGNNGRMSTPFPGTVVVAKGVEAGSGEQAPASVEFSYKITGVSDEGGTDYASKLFPAVRRNAQGQAVDAQGQPVDEADVRTDAVVYVGMDDEHNTFSLRDGETLTVANVPAGVTLAVEEQLTEVQKTTFTTATSLADNGDSVIVPQPAAGEAASISATASVAGEAVATFTSAFSAQPIDLTGENAVRAVLTMNGRGFSAGEFSFGLYASGVSATPLAVGTVAASARVPGTDTYVGQVTFTPTSLYDAQADADGTLTFRSATTDDAVYYVRQLRPSGEGVTTDGDGHTVFQGVTYDSAAYTLNVSVSVDPETGALTPSFEFSQDGAHADAAVFRDSYAASAEGLHIDLTATLFGRALRANGALRFTLENMGANLLDVNGNLVYATLDGGSGAWERVDADAAGAQTVNASTGDLTLRRSAGIALSNPAAEEGVASSEFSFTQLSYDSTSLRAAVSATGTALGDGTVRESEPDERGLRTYTVAYRVRELLDDTDVLGGYEANYEDGAMTMTRSKVADGLPDNGLNVADGYGRDYPVSVRLRDKGDGTFAVTYVYGTAEFGEDADTAVAGNSKDADAAGSALGFGVRYTPADCAISESMLLTYPYTLRLVGRDWLPSDTFTFSLVSTGANAAVTPMPGGAGYYAEKDSSEAQKAAGQSAKYRDGVTTPVGQPTEESEKPYLEATGDEYDPNLAHFGWRPTTYTQDALIELDDDGSPVEGGTHAASREFSWLLTWNETGIPGITPDARPTSATAVLVDDLEGALYVVPSVSLTSFTHTYQASARFAGLTISKTLEGRDLIENKYEFSAEALDTTDASLAEDERATRAQAAAKAAAGEAAVSDGKLAVYNDYEVAQWSGEGASAVFAATDMQTFFNGLQFTQDDLSNGDGTYASKRVFTYQVREVQGSASGYTYDDTVYTVAITVTDDAEAGALKLSADVSAVDGEGQPIESAAAHYADVSVGSDGRSVPVAFTGSYAASVEYDLETGAGGVAGVTFTKELAGAARAMTAGEFEFSLNLPGDVVVTTGANAAAAAGTAADVDFDPITFSVAVLEQQRRDAPTRVHREQRDDATGAVTYLARYAPNEDDSTFAQAGLSKRHVPAGVEFTLVDDGAGTLKVTRVTVADTTFTNYYNTDGTAQVQLVGTVNLTGSRAGGLKANEFSFGLTTQDSSYNGASWRPAGQVPLNFTAGSATATSAQTDDTVSDVVFGPLAFTRADMANASGTQAYQESFTAEVDGQQHTFGRTTYTYRVQQNSAPGAGVTLDTDTYDYVDVVLTYDETAGVLSAATAPSSSDSSDLKPAAGRVFRYDNAYTISTFTSSPTNGDTGVVLAKEMAGRNLVPGRLLVDIYDSDGAVVDRGVIQVDAQDGTKGTFSVPAGKFAFTQEDVRLGRITYRVREHEEFGAAAGGRTYDTSVYALAAELADNGDGTARVDWALTRGSHVSDDGKTATFYNSYDSEGQATPSVAMRMEDHELMAGGFTFEVFETSVPETGNVHEAAVTATGEALASAVNTANSEGQTTFIALDDFSYQLNSADNGAYALEGSGGMVERGVAQKVENANGSIDYLITYKLVQGGVTLERMPNVKATAGAYGFAMDVTLHESGTGTMTATVAYHELKEDGTRASSSSSALFVDAFVPTPEVSSPTGSTADTHQSGDPAYGQHISVTKTLSGRALAAGEFTYELYEGVYTGANTAKPVATGTNDAAGNVVLSPVTFTSASRVVGGIVQPSVFTLLEYRASDDPDDPARLRGVYYDRSVYRISATATEVVAESGDGDGAMVPTGDLKVDWAVVAKSPDARISSSAAIVATTASFTNVYEPEQTSVVPTDSSASNAGPLAVQIALSGRPPLGSTLRADLYYATDMNGTRPAQGAMPAAYGYITDTTAGEDGVYVANLDAGASVTFAEAGTYDFNLVEHVPANATWTDGRTGAAYRGIAYDLTSYDVHAVVTDDGAGNLSVKWYVGDVPADEDGAVRTAKFTNTYEPAIADIDENLTKQLIGREWTQDDSFTFVLTAIDGAPLPADARFVDSRTDQVLYTASAPTRASSNAAYLDLADFDLGALSISQDDLLNSGAEWEQGAREGQYSMSADFRYTVEEQIPADAVAQGTEVTYEQATGELAWSDADVRAATWAVGGTIYDARQVDVTLTVTDAGSGTIGHSLQLSGAASDEAVFANRYDVSETYEDSLVEAGLTLEGRGVVQVGDFQFSVEALGTRTVSANEAASRAGHVGETSWTELSTVETEDEYSASADSVELNQPLASFAGMTFSTADAGKTFSYRVALHDYGRLGYTFDDMAYQVELTVVDNGDGTLTVVTRLENAATGREMDVQESYEGVSSPVQAGFASSYAATGRALVEATAVLHGRSLAAGEFAFTLSSSLDGTGDVSATNAAADYSTEGARGLVRFPVISLTLADLRENAVFDSGYEDVNVGTEEEPEYERRAVREPSFTLNMTVAESWLYNRDSTGATTLRDQNIVRFIDEGYEADDVNATKAQSADVYETAYQKDLVVRFTDNGSGALVASVEYPEEYDDYGNPLPGNLDFEAKYLPEPVEVDMQAIPFSVQLAGREWDDARDFTVELAPYGYAGGEMSGYPLPIDEAAGAATTYTSDAGKVIIGTGEGQREVYYHEPASATKDSGTVQVYFGNLSFGMADMAGAEVNADGRLQKTFRYQVRELMPDDDAADADARMFDNIYYDNRLVSLYITVTDNGAGQLAYTAYKTDEADAANGVSFKNTYSASATLAAAGGVEVLTQAQGHGIEAGQLRYQVEALGADEAFAASGTPALPAELEGKSVSQADAMAKAGMASATQTRQMSAISNGGMAEIELFAAAGDYAGMSFAVNESESDLNKAYNYIVRPLDAMGNVLSPTSDAAGWTYDATQYRLTFEAFDEGAEGSLLIRVYVWSSADGGVTWAPLQRRVFVEGDNGPEEQYVGYYSINRFAPETVQLPFTESYAGEGAVELDAALRMDGRDLVNSYEFNWRLGSSAGPRVAYGTNASATAGDEGYAEGGITLHRLTAGDDADGGAVVADDSPNTLKFYVGDAGQGIVTEQGINLAAAAADDATGVRATTVTLDESGEENTYEAYEITLLGVESTAGTANGGAWPAGAYVVTGTNTASFTLVDKGDGTLVPHGLEYKVLGRSVSAALFENSFAPFDQGIATIAGYVQLAGRDIVYDEDGAGEFIYTLRPYSGSDMRVRDASKEDGWRAASSLTVAVDVEGRVNFGQIVYTTYDMSVALEEGANSRTQVFTYLMEQVVPDDAVNEDGLTWAGATDQQRSRYLLDAGGLPTADENPSFKPFSKNHVVYDGDFRQVVRASVTEYVNARDDEQRFSVSVEPIVTFGNRYEPAAISVNPVEADDAEDRNPLASSAHNEGFAVKKQLTGRDLRAGGFKFVLTDLNSFEVDDASGDLVRPTYTLTVLADGSATAGAVDSAGNVSFANVALPTFEQAGNYVFTLTEVNTGLPGVVAYDGRTYPVTATVSDSAKGELICVWTVEDPYGGNVVYDDATGEVISGEYTVEDNTALFQNVYSATMSEVPSATLTLTGRAQTAGGFTFLAVDSGFGGAATAQERAEHIWSVGTNGTGAAGVATSVSFTDLGVSTSSLDAAYNAGLATKETSTDGSSYVWCLPLLVYEETDEGILAELGREEWPGHVSITDPAVAEDQRAGHYVTVVAVDNENGVLVTRIVEGSQNASTYVAGAAALPASDYSVSFANAFTMDSLDSSLTGATADDGSFAVRAVMENRALEAGELSFKLIPETSAFDERTASNAADGSVSFDAFAFTQPGRWRFDLVADDGDLPTGVKRVDNARYTVVATATPNYTTRADGSEVENGTLSVEWRVYEGQVFLTPAGEVPDSAVEVSGALFDYRYEGAGTWTPSGVKELQGRAMRPDAFGGGFTFQLLQRDATADHAVVTGTDGEEIVVATGVNQRAAADENDLSVSPLSWTVGESGTRSFVQEVTLTGLEQMVEDGLASESGKGSARVFTTYYTMRETAAGSMADGLGVSATRMWGVGHAENYDYRMDEIAFGADWASDDNFKHGYDFEVTTRIASDGSLVSSVPTIYFENLYEAAPASATIVGVNAVSNPYGVPDEFGQDSYTFTLKGVDGAPIRTSADGESVESLVGENGSVATESTTRKSQNITFADALYFTSADLAGTEWVETVVSDGGTSSLRSVRTRTFTYSVTETGGQAGFSPVGGTEHTVDITVTDDGRGQLSASVSKVDGKTANFEFVNTYTASPVETGLYADFAASGDTLASVSLSGRTLADEGGEFAFRLTALDGAPLHESAEGADQDSATYRQVTNGAPENSSTSEGISGTAGIDFGKLVFVNDDMVENGDRKTERTFTYRVAAVLPTGPGAVTNADGSVTYRGVTYDPAEYTAKATVTDDVATGALKVSWKLTDAEGNEVDELSFANSYGATGSFTVRTHKLLTGRPMRANGFWFNLSVLSLADLSGYEETESVMYNQTRGNVAAHAVGEPARVNFENMTVTLEQLAGAVSRPGGSRNVELDEQTGKYVMHFRLTELRTYDEETPAGTVTHSWPAGVTPRFDEDASVVGHTNLGADDDMPYYLVDVEVNDNGDGTLSFEVASPQGLYNDPVTHTEPYVQFTNDYVADDSDAKVTVGGSATLIGREAPVRSNEFTFALYNVTPGAPSATRWVTTNGADGTFDLGTITFTDDDLGTLAANPWTSAGDSSVRERYFVYRIVESTSLSGVTRSDPKYFTVRLCDDGYGALTAVAKPGQLTTASAFNNDSNPATSDFDALFTNLYQVRAAESSPTSEAAGSVSVSMDLTGREWRDSDEFSFTLAEAGGSGRMAQSVSADRETGEVQMDAVQFTYLDLMVDGQSVPSRDIPFTLTMDDCAMAGVTADSQEATLVAHVRDNGNATVTVSWTVGYPGASADSSAHFTAHYNGATADGADVALRATAELRGRAIVNNTSFVYQLKYADDMGAVIKADGSTVGAVMLPYRAASSTRTQPFELASLGYTTDYLAELVAAGHATVATADDVSTYTVRYVATDDGSSLPDHVVRADSPAWHEIAVTLTDDGSGVLATSVTYEPDSRTQRAGTAANFAYEYVAENVLQLFAQSKMTGRALQAGELMYGVRLLPVEGAPNGAEAIDLMPAAEALDDAAPYAKNATAAADGEFCEQFEVDRIAIDKDQLYDWAGYYALKDAPLAERGTYTLTFEVYQVSEQGGVAQSVKLPQGVSIEEPAVMVHVSVYDDLDGNLTVTSVYGDGAESCAQFSNVYETQVLDTPAFVRASTRLDGRGALATDEGRFQLALYYAGSDERAVDYDGAELAVQQTELVNVEGDLLADGEESQSVALGPVRYSPEFLDELVQAGHAQLIYSEHGSDLRTLGTVVYEVHYAVREVVGEGAELAPVAEGGSLGAGVAAQTASYDIGVSVTVTDGKPTSTYVWYQPGQTAVCLVNAYAAAEAASVPVLAAVQVTGAGDGANDAEFSVVTRFADASGTPVDEPALPGTSTAAVSGVADASALAADEYDGVYDLAVTPAMLAELVEAGLAEKTSDATTGNNGYEFYLSVMADESKLPAGAKAPASALVKVNVAENVATGELAVTLTYLDAEGKPTADNRPAVLMSSALKAADPFSLAATKALYAAENANANSAPLAAAQMQTTADGQTVLVAQATSGRGTELAQQAGRFRFTAHYQAVDADGMWRASDTVATTGANGAAADGQVADVSFAPIVFGYESGTGAAGEVLVDVRELAEAGLAAADTRADGTVVYTVKLLVTEDKLAGNLPAAGVQANDQVFEVVLNAVETSTDEGTVLQVTSDSGTLRFVNVTASESTAIDLANAVVAAIGDVSFSGTAVTPALTVTYNGKALVQGVDYWVEYSGNNAPGIATATVHGMGDYTGTVSTQFAVRSTTGVWERLQGATALDTMASIVNAGDFPKGGTVVLATFDGYWDALTAAGVAGFAGAPVLMTDPNGLSSQTRTLLAKLAPTTLVIAGGTAALPDAVVNQAAAAAGGARVVRAFGQTATGTAARLYQTVIEQGWGTWSDTAFIATNDGYWDALAAAPVSYAQHMPIFLTEGSERLSDETLNAMKGAVKRVCIVGGTAAISEHVERQLAANGIQVVDRLAGATAIETSAAVAKYGLSLGMSVDRMGVATVNGYWDALSGSALCGHSGSVLVLASDEGSASISGFVKPNANSIFHGYVFGGPAAISDATYAALEAATSR